MWALSYKNFILQADFPPEISKSSFSLFNND